MRNITKYAWLVIVLGFNFLHAVEDQYRKMMEGHFIGCTDSEIWLYDIEHQTKKNTLSVTMHNVWDQENSKETITFQISNIYTPLVKENMTLSLRKNENIYVFNDETTLPTVFYKIEGGYTKKDMDQLRLLLFRSDYFQRRTKSSVKSYLMTYIGKIYPTLMKKINAEDFKSPAFLSENPDHQFKGLINWMCFFCIIGILCFAFAYPCFKSHSKEEERQEENDHRSKRIAHSLSPQIFHNAHFITISPENKIQCIQMRKIYLSHSPNSNLSRCSSYQIRTTYDEKIIQKHFRSSTDTETEESIPEVYPWLSNSHKIQSVSYQKIINQHFRNISS